MKFYAPVLLDQPRRQVVVVDAAKVVDPLADQHVVLDAGVGGALQHQHLVQRVADGQGLDVVAAKVLDELLHAVLVPDPDTVEGLLGVLVEAGPALDVDGGLGLDQLDEDVAVVALHGGLADAKVLHGGGGSPAAGEHAVRLAHPLGAKIVEIVLLQIVQIVAEENLELILELVGLRQSHLADGLGVKDGRGRLTNDPSAEVVPRYNSHRQ